jgi:hypothetical protein
VDLTALGGPGGPLEIEIRDLNQGQGISSAPVLATATQTLPSPVSGETLVTTRFATAARLSAGDSYGLVVRFLGEGSPPFFHPALAATCAGPGAALRRERGETQFSLIAAHVKLEHTVYVVP